MRDLKAYSIVALLALGIFLYVQYNQPAPVDWTRTYARTDKIPYGTRILYDLLPDYLDGVSVNPQRKRLYNALEDGEKQSDGYMMIASEMDIDEVDYERLVQFLQAGNDAFIASSMYSRTMRDSLQLRHEGFFSLKDSIAEVRFNNPNLDTATSYRFDQRTSGEYFGRFDTLRATVLATNQAGQAVFLRYPFGAGNLYLLASPDYFSNYNLLTPNGAAFASTALSYFHPKEQEVIWDDFQTMGALRQDSPMRVFLQDEYLRPAYLIALFSLLAFVLYSIKRRQRVIPIIQPLQNTSVEFAKVVSAVYYQQHDNRDILAKRYLYFLEHVRTTYHINLPVTDPDFVAYVSARSGVDESIVFRILQGIQDIDQGKPIDDRTLIAYNRPIEEFYQQTSWKNSISSNVQTSAN